MLRIKVSFLCFLIGVLSLADALGAASRSAAASGIGVAAFWAILGVGFKTRQIYRRRAEDDLAGQR
jgi:hypothetical protein